MKKYKSIILVPILIIGVFSLVFFTNSAMAQAYTINSSLTLNITSQNDEKPVLDVWGRTISGQHSGQSSQNYPSDKAIPVTWNENFDSNSVTVSVEKGYALGENYVKLTDTFGSIFTSTKLKGVKGNNSWSIPANSVVDSTSNLTRYYRIKVCDNTKFTISTTSPLCSLSNLFIIRKGSAPGIKLTGINYIASGNSLAYGTSFNIADGGQLYYSWQSINNSGARFSLYLKNESTGSEYKIAENITSGSGSPSSGNPASINSAYYIATLSKTSSIPSGNYRGEVKMTYNGLNYNSVGDIIYTINTGGVISVTPIPTISPTSTPSITPTSTPSHTPTPSVTPTSTPISTSTMTYINLSFEPNNLEKILGKKVLQINHQYKINWSTSNIPAGSTLNLEVLNRNGDKWTIIDSNIPRSGSYTWTVPSSMKATLIFDDMGLYLTYTDLHGKFIATGNDSINTGYINIIVSDVTPTPSPTATPTPVHTPTPTPVSNLSSFSVLSPQSGESWKVGSTHMVKWNYQGKAGDIVTMILSSKDGSEKTLKTVSVTAQQASVTIPSNIPAGQYTFIIRSVVATAFSSSYANIPITITGQFEANGTTVNDVASVSNSTSIFDNISGFFKKILGF